MVIRCIKTAVHRVQNPIHRPLTLTGLLVLVVSALLLDSCAVQPPIKDVTRITLCAGDNCGTIGNEYSEAQALNGIYRLIKGSENIPYKICEANPDSREIKDDDISMFIQGGPIPGIGSMKNAVISASELSFETQEVFYTVKSAMTFIGIPLATTSHKSRVHIASPSQIVLVEDDYYTNWMAVGNQIMSFNMAIDYVNLDRGQLGGYYNFVSTGIGMGKGSGYTILQFPVKMASGENWLDTSELPTFVDLQPSMDEALETSPVEPKVEMIQYPYTETGQVEAVQTSEVDSKQAKTVQAPEVGSKQQAEIVQTPEVESEHVEIVQIPEAEPVEITKPQKTPPEEATLKSQAELARLEQERVEIEHQQDQLKMKLKEAELEREKAELELARLKAEVEKKKAQARFEETARKEAELKLQETRVRMEEESRKRVELELKQTTLKLEEETRYRKEMEHKKAEELKERLGNYYALVIGNNLYKSLPKLMTAENDANEVAHILEQDYDFRTEVLLNATRSTIMMSLSSLRRRLTPKDNLLIYYAGHGWLDQDANEGYWFPVDASRENEVNWISNASITTFLKAMKAKHILVVADSCYSGKLVRGVKIQQQKPDYMAYLARMAEKKARLVIASGGLEPVSDSGGKGQHSVFASALIDVLKDNDNVIDSTTLFNKIRRPVMVNSIQTPQYADIRNAGHDGGDFIFLKQN